MEGSVKFRKSLEGNPFFEALMLSVSDEVFLLDAESLRILDASANVYKRFVTDLRGLQQIKLQVLLGVGPDVLADYVEEYGAQNDFPETLKKIPIKSEDSKSEELSVMLMRWQESQYLLAIRPIDQQVVQDGEARFQVLAANTPGLVFQLQIDQNGKMIFNYLSEGCKALLGVDADNLRDSPELFFSMMNEVDRGRFWDSMHASATELKMLNWEGRIWIDEWQDTKWINLRSTPKRLANGTIQWKGIMTNITQSKNERNELEQSRKRLAELSAHLTKIKEEERSRIAREIHDDLGGNLTAIKIGLSSILKRIPDDQPTLIERTKSLEAIVDNTFEAAHRISGDLRPNILELGVIPALAWQAKEFRKQMGVPCHFTTNRTESNETKEQAITLFRICQEAMSNIAKYAQAQRVDVGLFFEPDGIKMLIHDDGIGIQQSDMMKPNSFGLRGMAERVASLNGQFDISKSPNKGTSIFVMLPKDSKQINDEVNEPRDDNG